MKKFFFAVFLLLLVSVGAQAQTPYYQGKTIRIVTGYPAGDVNDLWPRLIAQHMTKYIPATLLIIQNMRGEEEKKGKGGGRRKKDREPGRDPEPEEKEQCPRRISK